MYIIIVLAALVCAATLARPGHPPRTATRPYASCRDWGRNQRGNGFWGLSSFYPRGAAANFYRTYCVAWSTSPVGRHFRSPPQHKNQQVKLHTVGHMEGLTTAYAFTALTTTSFSFTLI